jgi:hypothetical protein
VVLGGSSSEQGRYSLVRGIRFARLQVEAVGVRRLEHWLPAFAVLVAAFGAAGTVGALTRPDTAADLRRSGSVLFGVSTGVGPSDLTRLDRFERAAGKRAGLVNVYQAFGRTKFDPAVLELISARGSLPMVTWEPWNPTQGIEQPAFSLRRIRGGAFDAYVARWAAAAAAWGRPLVLRFAPEMNGDWNPWSTGVNGNRASEYVAAWRHVHSLFRRKGADNVAWVWSPNVVYRGSSPLAGLYPGDRYVDWVGLDGYNWGRSRPGRQWQGFDGVFGESLRLVRRLTRKPLMLSEVASSEVGGNKAAWIAEFFAGLRANPDVLAFVWFDYDKETDWRIDSSVRSRRAFARGVAAPRYRGATPPSSN